MALKAQMIFALPHLLWLLALPAALLAWELLRSRGVAGTDHPKILRAEAGMRTVTLSPDSSAKLPTTRRRILLCAGIALGIVALARPQWGRLDEPVFDQSREIVIALDLSRSMLTPDVKPSRLERSKLLIQSLLDHLKGERVGLVVFSGTAFLQSPISADYEILREFLPTMGPDFLPEGGTNYSQLIDTSLEAFGQSTASDRYLIILSDGEATDDNWHDRIPELAKKGIRVIGLGVGTRGGGMIPDGSGGFMKDENGAVVMSKLEGTTLRDLANATHGVYSDASEWVDLSKLLSDTVDQGRKGRFVEHNTVRYAERYQWALAQALLCLAASFWLEFPVKPKAREIRLNSPAKPKAAASVLVSALVAAFLFAGTLRAVEAPPPDPAATLSKIVGRLSDAEQCTALDWAELAGETVTWGEHLKSAGQEVPEGPVRDALRAVESGRQANPKAADWPQIHTQLEDLLKKPDDQKKDDQKQQDQKQDQDQKQKQDQQNKDQQNKDQNQDSKQDQQKQQDSQPKNDKQDQQRDQQNQQQKNSHDSKQQQKDSAFGNMNRPTPTPSAGSYQGATQKVGGARKDDTKDPARENPELAVPLQRLEQVKNQDSPAELFQMLRNGEPIPAPANNGKNW
jgi:Ca-activated chloride channel family protein